MTETQVIDDKKQAIDISQAWINSNGFHDVCKAKNFVMKIPVNKIYQMEEAYLFLVPAPKIFEELSEKADGINATKLSKIRALEEEAASLRSSMMPSPVDVEEDLNTHLSDYSRPPHPLIGQPLIDKHPSF
jgi:hypothetical protein